MMKIYKTLILMMLLISSVSFAQGMTTAAINGTITDDKGEFLPGANIIAVHEPTGTQYGVSSRSNGKFDLTALRTGGPYSITVSFVGYNPQEKKDVYLQLGQNMKISFTLTSESVKLSEVTVVAEKNAILSEGRTGASQSVSAKAIKVLPTVTRQFQDFSKLSPQFSGTSSSAAGRNNKFNNIQVDGTQYNDLFGLGNSGTPGGQTGTTPISLDAIDQFQVVVAPYDVRFSGFTGGGINAITKSGTNKFHASVYGYGRNQNLIGDSGVLEDNKAYPDFKEYQTGFTVGGPIIKDKLFFFVNGEIGRRTKPTTNLSLQTGNVAANRALAERMQKILTDKYGYDAGGFDAMDAERPSNKLFVRLDYNISKNHKLTLRHNYVNASDDILHNRNSSRRLAFNSYNYNINSVTNSTVAQLNSTFSNSMSNELIVGYTSIRDRRAGIGADLPQIEVRDAITLYAGPDKYSSANELDQDILEITDNFTYITGNHAITIGTHNELFSFRNLFIRKFFGDYRFKSVDDLENNKVDSYGRSFSRTSDPKQPAQFSVNQLGFYLQDEWSLLPNLKLTGGVRVDIPFLPDTPANNDSLTHYLPGYSTENVPSGNLLFSPRIGFNWDVSGDRTTQIRGGVGIFTGRIPYVWMSNSYGNTGTLYAEIRQERGGNVGFHADPNNQPGIGDPGTGAPGFRSEVDLVSTDFKFPQLLRYNAAVDQQLPLGFVGTVEFLYSQSVNDMLYTKINLKDATGELKNEARTEYDSNGKVSRKGRTIYGGTNSGNKNFYDVLELSNTDQGYQYSLTFQVQREVARGLSANMAYTMGRAKDLNSVTSSQARSQMRYNPIAYDPNNPELTTSSFEIQDRVMASLSYVAEFFTNAPTTFSLYYNGQSGRPFSFIAYGDINKDGFDQNDLFYIPRNESDILLGSIDRGSGAYQRASQSDYDALFSFIDNNDYLKENKGSISKRNGALNPWINTLDLKILQDIPDLWGMGHFQLSLDVLNLVNLIDSQSGWVERTQYNYQIVDYEGIDNATGKAVYSYNKSSNNTPFDADDLLSRWAMQFGVRYSF